MECIVRKLKAKMNNSSLPYVLNGNVVRTINGDSLEWIHGFYAAMKPGNLQPSSTMNYICFAEDVRIKVVAGCSVTMTDNDYNFMFNIYDEQMQPIYQYTGANVQQITFTKEMVSSFGYLRVSIRRVDSEPISQDDISHIVSNAKIVTSIVA